MHQSSRRSDSPRESARQSVSEAGPTHRFFVSRSGRHYVLDGQAFMWHHDRGQGWVRTERTLASIAADGRLQEVDSHLEFVHYARRDYEVLFGLDRGRR